MLNIKITTAFKKKFFCNGDSERCNLIHLPIKIIDASTFILLSNSHKAPHVTKTRGEANGII